MCPQVLVSYYEPDEEVPVATAELYLTGIGECCSRRCGEGVGLAEGRGKGLGLARCLPWVQVHCVNHLLPLPPQAHPPALTADLIPGTEATNLCVPESVLSH